jgi:hypothetical protein
MKVGRITAMVSLPLFSHPPRKPIRTGRSLDHRDKQTEMLSLYPNECPCGIQTTGPIAELPAPLIIQRLSNRGYVARILLPKPTPVRHNVMFSAEMSLPVFTSRACCRDGDPQNCGPKDLWAEVPVRAKCNVLPSGDS